MNIHLVLKSFGSHPYRGLGKFKRFSASIFKGFSIFGFASPCPALSIGDGAGSKRADLFESR